MGQVLFHPVAGDFRLYVESRHVDWLPSVE